MTMDLTLWMLKEGIRIYSKSVSAEKKLTLKADASFSVELKVVTRLGAIPVKGVKLKVGGEDFGTSDEKGEIKDGDKPKRKKVTGGTLEIAATYENKTEQVRKEQVTLELSEIDPGGKKAKRQAKHEIAKIRDAPKETDDDVFKREYDAAAGLSWAEVDRTRVLVTIELCTFSLAVPFMNQRATDDTVTTRPGLADGKDPETAAHAVKGPAKSGKFSGGVLCYPTSIKMLLDYWGQTKTRGEVMQEFYDQWAKDKFSGRKDKSAGAAMTTAPASPTEGQYWLDSTPGDAAGYALKKAVFELKWEALEGTDHTAKTEGKEAPKKFKEGDIWKDTSAATAVFKKAVNEFKEWTTLAEENWRVDAGGAKVWQFGWRATAVFNALKPSAAGHAAVDAPAVASLKETDPVTKKEKTLDDVVPLTKIMDEDAQADLKKINDKYGILDKYKEWLKSGWPFVLATTATDGHMMIARGAVVNEKGEIEWLIVNDPYGNLEGTGASYQADEKNAVSGAGSERGKNAYYRNETLGKDDKLRIKAGGRGFPRIEKAMTSVEIGKRLVPGA